MKRQFEKLRRLCGSHSAAARFLGYAPGWYRHLRNTHISAKTADYIRLKATELEALAAVNGGKLPETDEGAAHGD